jgi:hypothetical protein
MSARFTWVVAALACAGVVAASPPGAAATETDVFNLQSQVESGSRLAMRKLLSLEVDGAVAEDVDVVMGGAIRNHPEAFLGEIARTSKAQCAPCLEGLLGNLGDDFVDRFPEQVIELEKRKDALRSVEPAQLRTLRDRCVRILEMQIAEIQAIIEQESEAHR